MKEMQEFPELSLKLFCPSKMISKLKKEKRNPGCFLRLLREEREGGKKRRWKEREGGGEKLVIAKPNDTF